MSTVRVTTRPSYYATQEVENRSKKTGPRPETVLTGKLSLRMEIGGLREKLMRVQQSRIEKVVSTTLRRKGCYYRKYNHSDDRGYYYWDGLLLHQNTLYTDAFPICELINFEALTQALNDKGWYPESIILTYYPDGGNASTVHNLVTILESRRPLIEEALSLKEPMRIIVNHGLSLGITLSDFSYSAIEAAAFLIAQAGKMALTTGKARMKPCDMSNPKFQMRTWLLRLGFIGEKFERPRKTLLEGLDGDMAFFNEEQKRVAVAKRKAKKMNAPQTA